MTTEQQVEEFLKNFKVKLQIWGLIFRSGRTKNAQTILNLELTVLKVKEILGELKVEDYCEGPITEKMMEGAEADAIKSSALIFPELHYDKMDYTIKLNGTEKVNGKDAYKISVTDPAGKKSTNYYDAASKLKIRSVSPEGDVSFMDYKAVDGIMFPFKIKVVNPQMPMPLEMNVSEVKVNKGIDAAMFKVD